MTRFATPLIALALTAAPALAQEASGSVTAVVSYEARGWQVTPKQAQDSTMWREAGDTTLDVHITAREGPEATADDPNLTFSFETSIRGGDARAEDLAITLQQPGGAKPLYATPTNTDVTLNALTLEGDMLVVAGDFTAVLSPNQADRIVLDDAEGAVMMDGNFQATVPRAASVQKDNDQ